MSNQVVQPRRSWPSIRPGSENRRRTLGVRKAPTTTVDGIKTLPRPSLALNRPEEKVQQFRMGTAPMSSLASAQPYYQYKPSSQHEETFLIMYTYAANSSSSVNLYVVERKNRIVNYTNTIKGRVMYFLQCETYTVVLRRPPQQTSQRLRHTYPAETT